MTLKLVLLYKELLEASVAHKMAARAAAADARGSAEPRARRRRCTARTASTPKRCPRAKPSSLRRASPRRHQSR